MLEKNDWRLTNQDEYLTDTKLCKKDYHSPSPQWDHDHCVFCWDKFGNGESDLHDGYCTVNGNHWICKDCYNDFNEMFGFKLIDDK